MKLLFYTCWLVLLFIYFGMRELSDIKTVQSVLGLMDAYLAVVVPVGFAKSTISYVKCQQKIFMGAVYPIGFLLVFTLSQVMHGALGGLTSETLAMTQGPKIEEEIERLVNDALFSHHADQRAKAAALLYVVSGVKTMYQSKDGEYEVFVPSLEEQEERKKWKNSDAQVGAMKDQLLEQAIAITHRSIFHVVSFFVLFSVTFFFDAHRKNPRSHP